MTIEKAISRIDTLKTNLIPYETKVEWLSELDGRFKKEVIDTHEGGEGVEYTPYDTSTRPTTELLISAPYDSVYISWLEAKIDYTHADYQRYDNSTKMFETDYSAAVNAYNRAHRSKRIKVKYF